VSCLSKLVRDYVAMRRAASTRATSVKTKSRISQISPEFSWLFVLNFSVDANAGGDSDYLRDRRFKKWLPQRAWKVRCATYSGFTSGHISRYRGGMPLFWLHRVEGRDPVRARGAAAGFGFLIDAKVRVS